MSCNECRRPLSIHEVPCYTHTTKFCAVCMLPIDEEIADVVDLFAYSYTTPLLHNSCRRACIGGDRNLISLLERRDTLFPLSQHQAYLRAKAVTTNLVTQLWHEAPGSTSQLLSHMKRLPPELVDMIAGYTFPSVLSRCAITNWSRQCLEDPDDDLQDMIGYHELVELQESQHIAEPSILVLEVTESSFARWSLCHVEKLPATRPGSWYTCHKASILSDLVSELAQCLRSWRNLTWILFKYKGMRLRYWDVPRPPQVDTIEDPDPLGSMARTPVRIQTLDNTRPLLGLSAVCQREDTVALVLHHKDGSSSVRIRSLQRTWPNGVFRYWPLQEDNLSSIWVRYNAAFKYPPRNFVFETRSGCWLHTGPHLRSRYRDDFAKVTGPQLEHIALGTLDDYIPAIKYISTIPPAETPQYMSKPEAEPTYSEHFWPTSKRAPSSIDEILFQGNLHYSSVNASDFTTCILGFHRDKNRLSGVMFLSPDASAVLGQWRHGVDDGPDAQHLELADGVFLRNHSVGGGGFSRNTCRPDAMHLRDLSRPDSVLSSDQPGPMVRRAEHGQGIRLAGRLEWWFSNNWDRLETAEGDD